MSAKAQVSKPSKKEPAAELDRMSSLEIATLMNQRDSAILRAVRQALPQIAAAMDIIREKLASGGRLIFAGTGSSGRIGALEAAECPPTFGTAPAMVQFIVAGGDAALGMAAEADEDSAELGHRDMAARRPGKKDAVVGLSASGNTPYTIAALKLARSKGAATVAIVCQRGSQMAAIAGIAIEAVTGAEVLSGSTRLKAATAEKMICNMLTTGAFAQLGRVHGDQMINLLPRNHKLTERAIAIVQQIAKADRAAAIEALESAEMQPPVAILMLARGLTKAAAARRLKQAGGNLRRALED
jgi:N-acetylmuramic acid 6-phosphate etherase